MSLIWCNFFWVKWFTNWFSYCGRHWSSWNRKAEIFSSKIRIISTWFFSPREDFHNFHHNSAWSFAWFRFQAIDNLSTENLITRLTVWLVQDVRQGALSVLLDVWLSSFGSSPGGWARPTRVSAFLVGTLSFICITKLFIHSEFWLFLSCKKR
jgi:hypothetical protein